MKTRNERRSLYLVPLGVIVLVVLAGVVFACGCAAESSDKSVSTAAKGRKNYEARGWVRISGRVIDQDGNPIEGATVTAITKEP